ncbi:MAG: hypothetical protein AMJ81_07765 [Phycisphaerae bacterium SM23_33]|jgi:type IV pilus assembly protein PilM|nr:MAG: hypothetical protein AMJ81_07765 [Phycisphaerae bacterium SM23_33]
MAWKLSKPRAFPIGIDLGTAVIKMAQVRAVEDRLELLAAASAEVPADCREDVSRRMDFLGDQLPQLHKTGGFKGRKCVLSLPATETFVEHVKTAKMPPDELDKALRRELDGKLPCDPAEAVIRHVVAGETHDDREARLEVIAMGASRRVVGGYLEMARQSNLYVIGLSLEPCAILECFGRLFRRAGDEDRVTLFLDLGPTCTQVVMGHGAKLVFARNLMGGTRQLDEAAAAALGLSADQVSATRRQLSQPDSPCAELHRIHEAMGEALRSVTREITKCLRYYESVFPARSVERAIFLGGEALDRGLCQRMAQQINLTAQIGDPLTGIGPLAGTNAKNTLNRRVAQPAWAVAVGLSLGTQLQEAA